jgi:hypothetical protein
MGLAPRFQAALARLRAILDDPPRVPMHNCLGADAQLLKTGIQRTILPRPLLVNRLDINSVAVIQAGKEPLKMTPRPC